MTLGEDGGGTGGLEQAAMVGWGGAGRGACIAGEGRQKGGEADHDKADQSGVSGEAVETELWAVWGEALAEVCVCVNMEG